MMTHPKKGVNFFFFFFFFVDFFSQVFQSYLKDFTFADLSKYTVITSLKLDQKEEDMNKDTFYPKYIHSTKIFF